MTDGSWHIHTPAPLALGCTFYSGISQSTLGCTKQQWLTVVTCWVAHPLLDAFSSLSHLTSE